MVDLSIARFNLEQAERLARIEKRVNGIYGNGTGPPGELERLRADFHDGRQLTTAAIRDTNKAVAANGHDLRNLRQMIVDMAGKIDLMTLQGASWTKKDVLKVAAWGAGMLVTIVIAVIGALHGR